MDAPQVFALGAVGAGLLSLALQITVLFVDHGGGRRLLVRVAYAAAVLALAVSAGVLFL